MDEPNHDDRLPPLAAIAASAGGLNATKLLLQNMPPDSGIALVVIHHLAPDHESMIPELLQTVTEMEVTEVNEPLRPQANHVYTIPPDRYLEVKDGMILPVEPTAKRGHRMAVDHFLRTLAKNSGPQAMCVILSGTGTDGSLGLKEINEAGGLVLAQSPEQAEFRGMPASAISTQMVDRVLDAEQIPQLLVDFIQSGSLKEELSDDGTHKIQDSLEAILHRIRTHSGRDFSRYKKATLLRRIQRRMALARITKPEHYAELLENDPEEAQALFKDLLISVTRFFRDANVFVYLAEEVLPGLCSRLNDDEPLRIWVPGVATGEEAYSLAIIVQEHFLRQKKTCSVVIFATDIDTEALSTAREGRYPRSIEHDVSPERLERFFVKEGDHYRVNRDTRKMVTFAEQDILADPPYSRLDLISCRNLMIYLGQSVQQRTLALFHFALKPDGVLLLGTSETVGRHLSHLFKPVEPKRRVYRRIGSSRRLNGIMPYAPSERNSPAVKAPHRKKKEKPVATDLEETTRRAILDHITTCAVVVDRNMSVLYVHGTTSPYLTVPTGRMQNNLPLMAANGLQIRVRQVLQKVIDGGEPEARATGRLSVEETDYRIIVTARPMGEENPEHFVCFFDRREMLPAPAPEAISTEQEANRRIAELEHILKENREELSSTIEELEMSNEELRASNEEIISINEELQSSSEELETSKEELQSLNEELTTLNQQLQDKVEELTRAHDDMENLLESTEIATVFLDRDLNIRQTTPPADQLLNTRPADEGRPLSHFASPFRRTDLLEDARRVLTEEKPVEREIQTHAGRWYTLRVMPYRTGEGEIDGAVLTMVDIDGLKKTQDELADREQRLHLALEGGHMGTWDFDPSTGRIEWDRLMCRIFGIDPEKPPEETEAFYGFVHPDDRATVQRSVERALSETGQYEAEFRIRRGDGEGRWLAGRGRVFYDDDGRPSRMLGVNYDITEGKKTAEALKQLNEDLEQRVEARTQELRRSREEIRRLAHLAYTAEERERRRIAEGLHDDVQQLLTACAFSLQSLKADGLEAETRNRITKVAQWSQQALHATRSLIFDLSPAVLYEIGLDAALNHLLGQMKEKHGLAVTLDRNGEIDPLPEASRVFVYSAIRELLFNVTKHADTDHAVLRILREEDLMRVQVTDEGRGFQPEEIEGMKPREEDPSGLGLASLRERLIPFGGTLQLASVPGQGTDVRFSVPTQGK